MHLESVGEWHPFHFPPNCLLVFVVALHELPPDRKPSKPSASVPKLQRHRILDCLGREVVDPSCHIEMTRVAEPPMIGVAWRSSGEDDERILGLLPLFGCQIMAVATMMPMEVIGRDR